jgi:hypothetical protein
MPIPEETPNELHPALKRLSEHTDLVGYQAFVARKTRHGTRHGSEPWVFTKQYVGKHSLCAPDEAIQLLQEAGADNDVEALFHVAVSLHLIP